MRKFLLAFVAFGVLGASQALAADMVRPAPRVVVAPAPKAFNWTGIYFGVQGGYGWGDSVIDFGAAVPVDIKGAFVGGEISALWQISNFVLGAYAEGNYSWIAGSTDVGGPNIFGTNINWFGSAGGKVGFAVDRWLVYGTGGFAFGQIATSQNTIAPSSFSQTGSYTGWTAGAGVDYAITNNIVLGVQYKYYDFGSVAFDTPAPFTDRTQDVQLHTVSAKAALKF